MNFQLEHVRTVPDQPVLGPTGSGAWIPDCLPDFGLDIGQYKPSGDDGRTDVGDDTCGFDIADTAVETCVVVDFGDQSDKINSVDRMLEADTCTDSVVHILA